MMMTLSEETSSRKVRGQQYSSHFSHSFNVLFPQSVSVWVNCRPGFAASASSSTLHRRRQSNASRWMLTDDTPNVVERPSGDRTTWTTKSMALTVQQRRATASAARAWMNSSVSVIDLIINQSINQSIRQ